MLEAISIEEQILEILSTKYQIEIYEDEDLDFSDETNLCVHIIDKNFDVQDIRGMVKHLNIRVVKYGNIAVFEK